MSYVWFLSQPSKILPILGPLGNVQWGASSKLLVLAGGFYKYAPGPTITGVEQVGASADAPGISLLYPNEYCAGVGTSGFIAGSY